MTPTWQARDNSGNQRANRLNGSGSIRNQCWRFSGRSYAPHSTVRLIHASVWCHQCSFPLLAFAHSAAPPGGFSVLELLMRMVISGLLAGDVGHKLFAQIGKSANHKSKSRGHKSTPWARRLSNTDSTGAATPAAAKTLPR